MLGITAAAYVPYYAAMLLIKAGAGGNAGAPGRTIATILSEVLFIILWASLALPIATGAGTYAISERYLGNEVTIGQALNRAVKSLWTLSVAQFAVVLWVFIGFVLLIVPGILWSLSYALVVPVVLVEGRKATPSLRRSWELVKDNRWKVFAVLLIVSALQWLLGFVHFFRCSRQILPAPARCDPSWALAPSRRLRLPRTIPPAALPTSPARWPWAFGNRSRAALRRGFQAVQSCLLDPECPRPFRAAAQSRASSAAFVGNRRRSTWWRNSARREFQRAAAWWFQNFPHPAPASCSSVHARRVRSRVRCL